MAGQATALNHIDSTSVPQITDIAGSIATQATAALPSVVSDAASVATSVADRILGNSTAGIKYVCIASSCDQIHVLLVVLGLGLSITVLSAVALALTFFLPFMKFLTLGCSTLALLFYVLFAGCVVCIAEIASLNAVSTFFKATRGEVFPESLWALGFAAVLAFSALGHIFM